MFIKFVSDCMDVESDKFRWYSNIVECQEACVTMEHIGGVKKIFVTLDDGSHYEYLRSEISVYLMNENGKTIDSWPAIWDAEKGLHTPWHEPTVSTEELHNGLVNSKDEIVTIKV